MDTIEDADAQTRRIQHDIERTRHQMDRTLTELENRLAPSEILHRGAGTLRERLRELGDGIVDTVKRHPSSLAIAAMLLGTGYAMRPTAEERLERRAQHDFDRAWRIMQIGLGRAREQSQLGTAKLERVLRDLAADAVTYARPALQTAGRVGQLGSARARNNPLATLALLGLAIGFASWQRRRRAY